MRQGDIFFYYPNESAYLLYRTTLWLWFVCCDEICTSNCNLWCSLMGHYNATKKTTPCQYHINIINVKAVHNNNIPHRKCRYTRKWGSRRELGCFVGEVDVDKIILQQNCNVPLSDKFSLRVLSFFSYFQRSPGKQHHHPVRVGSAALVQVEDTVSILIFLLVASFVLP